MCQSESVGAVQLFLALNAFVEVKYLHKYIKTDRVTQDRKIGENNIFKVRIQSHMTQAQHKDPRGLTRERAD